MKDISTIVRERIEGAGLIVRHVGRPVLEPDGSLTIEPVIGIPQALLDAPLTSPDRLPIARVAEIHDDALALGGCAEVNECELVALTAEVLQARSARMTSDETMVLRWIAGVAMTWSGPDAPKARALLEKLIAAHGVRP